MKNSVSRRVFSLGLLGLGSSALVTVPALADAGAEAYVRKLGLDVINLANAGKRGDKGFQYPDQLLRAMKSPSFRITNHLHRCIFHRRPQ